MSAPASPSPPYFASPWPAEDGGPCRLQWVHGTDGSPHPGLGLPARGGRLRAVRRHALASTMVVLRQPGEVFLLRHTLFRSYAGLPTHAWVERLDPLTLEPRQSSPRLEGGPFWPGGLAAHANGSLYVVYGRWAHRLGPDCAPLASRRLPVDRPYNSFVLLSDGCLATKDFDRARRHPSTLCILEPERLEQAAAPLTLPEPCVARLSARGDAIYLVGEQHLYRALWESRAGRLRLDEGWRIPYASPGGSYGWDPVLEGDRLWLMDNGDHTYRYHLLGEGVARGPVHLISVSTSGASAGRTTEISGRPSGAITNPPLLTLAGGRRRVLAYDSANAVLAAWHQDDQGQGELAWRKDGFACGGHMLHFPSTGEVVTADFRRLGGDALVVLDAASGQERARVQTGSRFQSVLFPSPGWNRDVYYVSFSTVARTFVDA